MLRFDLSFWWETTRSIETGDAFRLPKPFDGFHFRIKLFEAGFLGGTLIGNTLISAMDLPAQSLASESEVWNSQIPKGRTVL